MTKNTGMEQLTIRQARDGDYSKIYHVLTQAFNGPDESKLVDALRKSKDFIPELSIVAALDNKIVGYILFSRVLIIDSEKNTMHPSLALAPVAVLPENQNIKIGSKLIHQGIEQATTLGHNSIIVLGYATFYTRFGFKPALNWNITTHYEVASENFMALELKNGALDSVSGQVKYPKEFELFD